MQIKKTRKALPLPEEETKKSTEARFAWAVGATWLEQHDPLYHVTESFQQSFDRIGRSHAAAAAGFRSRSGDGEREEKDQPETERKRKDGKTTEDGPQTAAPGKEQINERPEENARLTKFSEIAFKRGAMSSAVLNGTGKMMLVSCLKRTAYQHEPRRLQQRTLSVKEARIRPIPGHSPDQLLVNQGFAHSALGIVVDTLRDARRVVESMTLVARSADEATQSDRAALYRIYPFLDDSRDAALEAEYREKLAGCTDERMKPLLQNALVKTLSLRAKKAQMKNEFINKLRFISDRATETLSELEAAGIEDELVAAAFGEGSDELPENPDEGADGDAPNRNKNGSEEAARTGAAAGAEETKR